MNTPVSFEIAKLLKEKGYDETTQLIYMTNHTSEVLFENINGLKHSDGNNPFCSAPTIAEVVMWLYEKYGIWLKIGLYTHLGNVSKFQFTIETKKHKSINSIVQLNTNPYKSLQKAYEAAITHTLNNLI